MRREWKPGDVVKVTFDNATGNQRSQGINRIKTVVAMVDADHVGSGLEPAEAWFVFGATWRIGATWECVRDVRPLVVIDPEDREAVARLVKVLTDAMPRVITGIGPNNPEALDRDYVDFTQAALREFADPTPPKVYREHTGSLAPWPVVDECHSSHREDHECPQCAWEHEHDWVAWVTRTNTAGFSNGTPIRCSKCGARKCDRDDCTRRRHTHNHQGDS